MMRSSQTQPLTSYRAAHPTAQTSLLSPIASVRRPLCLTEMCLDHFAAVLATDMAHHNELVAQLNEHADGPADMVIPPHEVIAAFCHTADLANVVLRWDLAEPWSARVGEEAINEFNEMKRIGLPLPGYAQLQPYSKEELAARQIVFSDGWVGPLYAAAARLFPGAQDRLAVIHANREACKSIHKEAVKKRLRAKLRVVMKFRRASTFRDVLPTATTAAMRAAADMADDGTIAEDVAPVSDAVSSEVALHAEASMTLSSSFQKRPDKERDLGASVGGDELKSSSPSSPTSVIAS